MRERGRRAGRGGLRAGLLSFLAAWSVGAFAQGAAPGAERVPAFPLDAVVAGLEGFALTETADGIELFPVTLLALQEGSQGGIPLVLVRADGPLIEAAGGVAAGMSGSPVYVPHEGTDALLGAIAYVFPQSDARLALVTPIGAMRAQTARSLAGDEADGRALASRLAALGAHPVTTPVLIGGLGARALGLLERSVLALAPHVLEGIGAGGTGTTGGAEVASVRPGAAVALQLVRGDITIAAIGTVTEVAGDEVLAFGHPFLGVGPTSWPLTTARVTAIVPSRLVPFKLANVGDTLLGAVVQDRPAGIGARLGQDPDVIPVTLGITTATLRTALRFDVVADEALWPLLVAVASLEAIDRAWQRTGSGTADVAWEIDLPGGAPLRLTEQITHSVDVSLAAAGLAGAPLAILARNAFQAARPAAVQIAITIDERRRDAEIVEVLQDGPSPAVGGPLDLVLRLQPWRRASEVKTFSAVLPAGLEGPFDVQVRGGGEPRDEEDDPFPDVLLSYGELLVALRERPQGADLVVEVRAPGEGWQELGRLSLPYVVQGVRTLSLETSLETSLDTSAAGGDPDASDPPGGEP